jgi:hypothetical protein
MDNYGASIAHIQNTGQPGGRFICCKKTLFWRTKHKRPDYEQCNRSAGNNMSKPLHGTSYIHTEATTPLVHNNICMTTHTNIQRCEEQGCLDYPVKSSQE